MQKVHVFGLDYQSANFDLREKLAFSSEEILIALKRLKDSGVVNEAVILSTCNRTEIYCMASDIDFVINSVCDMQNICPRSIKNSCYIYVNEECVKHLFRVSSGLTSMVLGETEIVAQIKESIALSRQAGSMGSFLSGVFHMALNASKEVRTTSKIDRIAVSMGSACVELVSTFISKSNIDIAQHRILFIGAGQMMRQVAPHFSAMSFEHSAVINRTFSNAEILAKRINAVPLALTQLSDIISNYSIIIASCNSVEPLIGSQLLNSAINSVNTNKILIIDLSMPLVVDVKLKQNSDNITLLTIDDIAKIVDVGIEKRKLVATKAEQVINDKLVEYQAWLKKRSLSPVIKALRDDAELIRQDALMLAIKELENGEDTKSVIENLSMRLTNKLLHAPTVNLCVANDIIMQDNLVNLVNHLYDLKSN